MRLSLFMMYPLISFPWKLAPPPNFCVNCVHFITSPTNPEYGKCRAFPIKDNSYLVCGVIKDGNYRYCETARNSETLCGRVGKFYKPNVENEEILPIVYNKFPTYFSRHKTPTIPTSSPWKPSSASLIDSSNSSRFASVFRKPFSKN